MKETDSTFFDVEFMLVIS